MPRASLCPKPLQPRMGVKHRQSSPGPIPFGAHANPFQCRQVVVSSLPSTHTHTHAPWPGCTSIHSYCRQQPGLHPIPRENFRQSQFSVLCAACSGTQSPACGRRDRVIYLQGQGDQPLSTNELFHFQWGQRKPTPKTPLPTLSCNVRWRTSSLCPQSSSLPLPRCCPRHPRGQLHPAAVFSLLPQPLHYLSLFITQMPQHNGLYI